MKDLEGTETPVSSNPEMLQVIVNAVLRSFRPARDKLTPDGGIQQRCESVTAAPFTVY